MVPAFGRVILPQNLSTGNGKIPGCSCILSVVYSCTPSTTVYPPSRTPSLPQPRSAHPPVLPHSLPPSNIVCPATVRPTNNQTALVSSRATTVRPIKSKHRLCLVEVVVGRSAQPDIACVKSRSLLGGVASPVTRWRSSTYRGVPGRPCWRSSRGRTPSTHRVFDFHFS